MQSVNPEIATSPAFWRGTVRWIVKRVLPLALICASGAGRGDCL